MKNKIMPWVARALSSTIFLQAKRGFYKVKRTLLGKPEELEVYLSISDPYSYLLIQVFPGLIAHYNVGYRLFIIQGRQAEMFPEMEKWQTNAIKDTHHLAKLYLLNFPINPSLRLDTDRVNHYTASLLQAVHSLEDIKNVQTLFESYWSDEPVVKQLTLNNLQQSELEQSQKRLKKLGHYFSAMIYFEGEWYWGLDRLVHLERRFTQQKSTNLMFNKQNELFCQKTPTHSPSEKMLVMYYSARSPYSFIGLEKALRLCV